MRPVKVIAITGGKGGVGKTNLSINLGVALAEMGRRTLLMDADLGLANVDVLLGLKPVHTLADLLAGRAQLGGVIMRGPGGLKIVPAASGLAHMAQLSTAEHAGLVRSFSDFEEQVDVFLIDTAAGISDTVLSFVRAAQEVVVVVCDEPSSIADAYGLIKIIANDHGVNHIRVVANMTRRASEGEQLFNKLNGVCDRFLDVTLQYLGAIPFDEQVRKAVQARRPLVQMAPTSRAATALRQLAEKVDRMPAPAGAAGHVQFFFERLLESPAAASF